MAVAQRLRQGVRALFAFSQPVDLDLASQYLTPELLDLFRQMQHSEQLHSLNVQRSVLEQGSVSHDLAVAALLHDVGKVRSPLMVWQKTLSVLVRAALPALFQRWSRGSLTNPLQQPFVVYVRHPEWSAEMLAQAGASETAVWLVRHHADDAQALQHPAVQLLKRLQAADDLN